MKIDEQFRTTINCHRDLTISDFFILFIKANYPHHIIERSLHLTSKASIMKYIPFIMIMLLLGACAYNNEEDLYPGGSGACDTSRVTFSEDVFPVIDNNCLPCHGGSSPPMGIDLTDYSGIRQAADDGSLLGAIKHQSGYSPMPKDAPQLPECQIATVEAWIKDGMPDN